MRAQEAAARAAVRRTRRVLGRLKRRGRRVARAGAVRARRAAHTGTVRARLLIRRRRWRALYVLASGEELGALPRPVLDEISSAVAAGMPVEVLLLDFSWDARPARLPFGVTVHRFWEDAAPGGGAYVPDSEPTTEPTTELTSGPATEHAGATVAPVPQPDGRWLPGRYRDGMPVVAVDANVAGTRVEHYGPAGLPVRRDELDQHGTLVRVLDLNASDGAEVAHRYFDASGACWLSAGVDGGSRDLVLRHLPSPARYPNLAAVQAEWVTRRVSVAVSPVVVSAGPASSAIEQRVRRDVLTAR